MDCLSYICCSCSGDHSDLESDSQVTEYCSKEQRNLKPRHTPILLDLCSHVQLPGKRASFSISHPQFTTSPAPVAHITCSQYNSKKVIHAHVQAIQSYYHHRNTIIRLCLCSNCPQNLNTPHRHPLRRCARKHCTVLDENQDRAHHLPQLDRRGYY